MAAMGGHSMALYNLGLMRMSCSKYNTEAQLAEADCSCGCNRVEGLGLLEKAAKLGLAEVGQSAILSFSSSSVFGFLATEHGT